MVVIIIKSNTSREGVDMAFETMCVKYRDLIRNYCTEHNIMINELLANAGCEDEKMMKDFIIEGMPIPTGRDLDRLLGETFLKQRFADEVPVVLGSDVIYPVNLGGTKIANTTKKIEEKVEHAFGNAVPEKVDRKSRNGLAKNCWFYRQASQRYLAQQAAG